MLWVAGRPLIEVKDGAVRLYLRFEASGAEAEVAAEKAAAVENIVFQAGDAVSNGMFPTAEKAVAECSGFEAGACMTGRDEVVRKLGEAIAGKLDEIVALHARMDEAGAIYSDPVRQAELVKRVAGGN